MIVDRYYYSQLNKSEQEIYKAFYKGVMAHQGIIPIPVKGSFSEEKFSKIFMAITLDNPLIYYLNQSACSIAQDGLGHTAICPQYFFKQDKVREYNRKIEQTVNELVAQLMLTEGTDYEKAIKVHDWLCKNVVYDEKGADMEEIIRVIASHNIIGVFAHHKAQCEGIAKAVKVLLNVVDVRCIVATGMAISTKENGPHAWNVVNLDNTPYHMDVTWDIGAMNTAKDRVPYDYFNITDDMITVEHKAENKLPECKSLELNYFTKNKLVFSSKERLFAYVERCLNSGKNEFYFRIEGKAKKVNIARELNEFIAKYFAEKGNGSIKLRHIENENMRTYWIKIN